MRFRLAFVLLLGTFLRPPVVSAQWTRVTDVPATEVGALYVHAGVFYAGALDAVYTSRDDGRTWQRSASLPPEADGVWALAVHEGRLFAGTYNGVYESPDEGATWLHRSAGLDGLGAEDVTSLVVHAGSLYAGTAGAGVYRLALAAAEPVWERDANGLPGNTDALAVAGEKLIAGGGANGYVFLREAGAWTPYRYVAFDANGPQMYDILDLGGVLLGAGSHGLFRSLDGGRTWTRFNPGVGIFSDASLTADGRLVYAVATRVSGGTYVYTSSDAGLTWTLVERVPGAYTTVPPCRATASTPGASMASGFAPAFRPPLECLRAPRPPGLWTSGRIPSGPPRRSSTTSPPTPTCTSRPSISRGAASPRSCGSVSARAATT